MAGQPEKSPSPERRADYRNKLNKNFPVSNENFLAVRIPSCQVDKLGDTKDQAARKTQCLRAFLIFRGQFHTIYARIVVNKSKCELGMKQTIDKDDWNPERGACN